MFEFPGIGPLAPEAAREALVLPARRLGVAWSPGALDAVLAGTSGYPCFLQEWGKHSWNRAPRSPITPRAVHDATAVAMAELDAGFFRVRFDRLAPAEKRHLRAMAELGAGPHRSEEIAAQLGKGVPSVAPTRAALIAKGIVFSAACGDTSFTVPHFDAYLKRVIPEAG